MEQSWAGLATLGGRRATATAKDTGPEQVSALHKDWLTHATLLQTTCCPSLFEVSQDPQKMSPLSLFCLRRCCDQCPPLTPLPLLLERTPWG